jgi:hypothetical protein
MAPSRNEHLKLVYKDQKGDDRQGVGHTPWSFRKRKIKTEREKELLEILIYKIEIIN